MIGKGQNGESVVRSGSKRRDEGDNNIDHNQDEKDDENMDQKDEVENNNRFNLNNLNLK